MAHVFDRPVAQPAAADIRLIRTDVNHRGVWFAAKPRL
jgi:hypothetical protein